MTVPWMAPPSRPSTSSLKSVDSHSIAYMPSGRGDRERARDLPPALEIGVVEKRLHHPRRRRLDQLRVCDVEDLGVDRPLS